MKTLGEIDSIDRVGSFDGDLSVIVQYNVVYLTSDQLIAICHQEADWRNWIRINIAMA